MKPQVRTLRFLYNGENRDARFYSFSTWSDDITRYFSTSSGTVVTPVAFLAFKIGGSVEDILNKLSQYFENKLASVREEYFANPECDYNLLQ